MQEKEKIKKIINYYNKAVELISLKKDYEKAKQKLLKVVKYFEKNNPKRKYLTYLLNSYKYLGFNIYGEYEKNLANVQFYLTKYLSYDKKMQFKPIYYLYLALTQLKLKNYDLAYKNFKRAYKVAKKQNDYDSQFYIFNEMGNYHYYKGKYKNAIRYKQMALALIKTKKKFYENEIYRNKCSVVYHDLTFPYAELGNYDKVFEYIEKFFEYVDKSSLLYYSGIFAALTDALNIHDKKRTQKYYKMIKNEVNPEKLKKRYLEEYYSVLSKYYEEMKQYKNAYKYYLKSVELQKRMIEEENEKNIHELQVKFEVEKKKQEKQIYQLENRKLKNINLNKDKFFSIIAHDLRSPFATIYSFISLMKKNQKNLTKEKILEILEELDKVVNNTYALLENLLEWSRLQSGVLNYSPSNFDICSSIASIIDIYKQNANQKKIELTLQCLNDNLKVFGDKFMISTIIRNFLNNAIKFTPENGKIEIKVYKKNRSIYVSVKDTGIGMTKEEQEKLFQLEKIFSKPGTNNEKGTGLGLILCKEFAKKNKAEIFVESEKGKGSKFILKLKMEKKNK